MQKFSLHNRKQDVIKWHGGSIELNLSFDNVLLLFNLLKNDQLDYYIRLDIAIDMLVVDKEILKEIPPQLVLDFIYDVLKEKLNIDLRQTYVEPTTVEEIVVPIYDFDEDAEYIYSSFLMDYGIDLIEQQGRLQWDRFLVLFKNLSDETPMGKALYYRTCEIPKYTKDNAEERKRIRKMKKKYELQCAKPLLDKKNQLMYEKSMKQFKERERLKNR